MAVLEGLVLIDTNILIYAHYREDNGKCDIAANVVLDLGKSGRGVLSVQTLSESYWVMVYKRKPGLAPELAHQILTDYSETWPVISPTRTTFIKALNGVRDNKFSFWDAMQWAIAAEYGVPTILSEDFAHGQIIEGVKFINPFMPV